MKFILDEGIDYHLAEFLQHYGFDVDPITKQFRASVKDSVWIPRVGRRGWVIITTDKRLSRRPSERDAYRRHRLRGFYVPMKGLRGFDIARRIIGHWYNIVAIANEEEPPYFYRLSKGYARADLANVLQETEGRRRPPRAGKKRRRAGPGPAAAGAPG